MKLIEREQACDKIVIHLEETEAGLTVKEFLRKQWQVSGRLLTRLKKEETVHLNGRWAPFHQKLAAGDVLQLGMAEEACDFVSQPLAFEVVYEDMDVMVVNKPPSMLTHPTVNLRKDTLANGLMNYMMERGEKYKVRFVNRLDMDTSGVMIIAKNAFSHHSLMLQMKEDQTIKTYRVLVWGRLSEDEGTIDAPIYRQEDLPADEPPRRIVDLRGKRAISHFQVEERYTNASLVRVTIETGRTHQIRVHMKHLGHPVIGDYFYEPDQPRLIERQALHAAETSFYQPRRGHLIQVTAGLPEDLVALQQRLKETDGGLLREPMKRK